jgi:[ribosomal protein S18]-alanine N-acetyltransferase
MPTLAIRSLESPEEARACARLMAESEPWLTLGRGYDHCLALVRDAACERYLAYDGERLAGFVVLLMKGAFVGYIRTICVAPESRGRGVGSALIRYAEERIFGEHPNVFLCVSSFNTAARAFYERLGYGVVGEVKDYVVAGHSEFLLRKSRGPMATWRPVQ